MTKEFDEREKSNYDHQNQFDGDWLEHAIRANAGHEHVPGALCSGELSMKIFIDCEYNGMGGQLLSIALVPEDLQFENLYREQVIHEPIQDWVQENVIPKLRQIEGTYAPCTREQLQIDIALYLNQYDRIHLIADWPDDIKYFCDLLITGPGKRLNTPALIMEVRRDLDCESSNPHHALADAQAMRNHYISKGLS